MDVIKQVKPIFEDLSNETLLKKCLHEKTRNQNESYNGMIWHRIPKTILISSTTFDIGVYDAAAHFNPGNMATLEIFDEIGIERGSFTILGCHDDNQKRIENSQRKSSDIYRGRRSELRGSKKKEKG